MYRSKRFRPQPESVIQQQITQAQAQCNASINRVFLADGDAFCLSTRRLIPILTQINHAFPSLQRIGIYANARDILAKSPEELRSLRQQKLRMLYLGLESGDDETLNRVQKGATAKQMLQAVRRAQAADMAVSVMVLVGLAGRERSLIHARASASIVNLMEPRHIALLTYTPTPHSPLFEEVVHGSFELLSPLESLVEIREFIANLNCRTYFTCNHASNYLPLTGKFPSAQKGLLAVIDAALAGEVPLKPEMFRGL
jgi:radical SAM superfamily enzyme YgiQ (UPF0313 family)